MAGIFLSYRRSDSAAWTRLLREAFARELPDVHVFRDIEAILPGDDFVRELDAAVAACDVMLVIIGPGWVDATDRKTGRRRIEQADDFTRLEVATALRCGVRVIPVLVDGAPMPTAAQLPPDLQALVMRQNVEMNDRHWEAGCAQLCDVLRRVLPGAATARAGPGRAPAPGVRRTLVAGGIGALVLGGSGLAWWSRRERGAGAATVHAGMAAASRPGTGTSGGTSGGTTGGTNGGTSGSGGATAAGARPPSIAELPLAHAWTPTSTATPPAPALVLTQTLDGWRVALRPAGGPADAPAQRFGDLLVEPELLTFRSEDGRFRLVLRRQADAPRHWAVRLFERRGDALAPAAEGEADVDSSGRVWHGALTLQAGHEPIEVTASLSRRGTRLEARGWTTRADGSTATRFDWSWSREG